jgi:hypothetical protein
MGIWQFLRSVFFLIGDYAGRPGGMSVDALRELGIIQPAYYFCKQSLLVLSDEVLGC